MLCSHSTKLWIVKHARWVFFHFPHSCTHTQTHTHTLTHKHKRNRIQTDTQILIHTQKVFFPSFVFSQLSPLQTWRCWFTVPFWSEHEADRHFYVLWGLTAPAQDYHLWLRSGLMWEQATKLPGCLWGFCLKEIVKPNFTGAFPNISSSTNVFSVL